MKGLFASNQMPSVVDTRLLSYCTKQASAIERRQSVIPRGKVKAFASVRCFLLCRLNEEALKRLG
jgi:hypothetical protein